MNYMYWADVAMYVTGGIVFLLLLLMMIHHKIRYINRLESELKILGGGNLEYPITIKGNDEITSLAEGITALKNGFSILLPVNTLSAILTASALPTTAPANVLPIQNSLMPDKPIITHLTASY